MTTLHLHIGMHKTGTSAFQNACERDRDLLEAQGFTYHRDDLFLGNNHSYFRELLEQHGTRELERAIRAAFEKNQSPNYIISGEDFSYLEVGNVALLASIFREYFAEIRAYAVLRSPIAYMHSATQEILKDPFAGIDDLFKRWDVTPSYERRFQKFIDFCGPIEFIPYSPTAPQEMALRMGIPKALREFPIVNQSVSRWTVKMLAAMKPFRSWDAVQEMTEKLAARDRFPAYSHAPAELVEHWADHVARDRAWLETVWQAPPGFFDEPPATVPRSYYETFSIEEVRLLRSIAA